MNTEAKYTKWEPLEALPKRMYCEAIHNDYEGIRFLLKGEAESSPTLRIKFESVIAYRSIDEGCLQRTLDNLKARELFPLYKVQNSEFLSWLRKESYDSYNDRNIAHYALFCQDEIIDILSEFEPIVEWLNC
nr:hypothetical protein [uncultured Desulfobacter sp.]